jgi:2-oxoisovalerate dehydrogenase E1 component
LLAKSHYRWLEKADVVVRMPAVAEPKRDLSQTNEAWFTKPGLSGLSLFRLMLRFTKCFNQ